MRISSFPGSRYFVALCFVALALGLSLLFQPFVPNAFLIFFLTAVMLAGWFGRTGAGLFAVFISMLGVAYYFISPRDALEVEVGELPYFLAFLLSAVVTSWLGSARRAAEDKQKAHLDELFEQTPEAIILVDLQDRVLRINKRFSQIFGYVLDDIAGKHSLDLIVPSHLRTEAHKVRERLADGQDVNVETIRIRKDGSHVNVSEVSFPVIVNGKYIASYVILRDITDSKRALENLARTQAELTHLSRITTMGELAASIAHEINQPIGAMVTNGNAGLRWLGQSPPHVEGAKEALECIVRDANRAAQVIWKIRALLKKNPAPMVHLDINEVIQEVVVLAAHETERRETTVTTELSNDVPPILGDRVQLQQVMLNLIMNSLDALSGITDRPRRLLIKTARNRESVVVQVEDSGSGWDDKDANFIFEPFFTTKKDGIGMGLTISRSIIETHGGRLWAEKRSPSGAILSFTLPVPARAE